MLKFRVRTNIDEVLAHKLAAAATKAEHNFTVNLDGKTVAKNTVKHINNMTRQAGKPVLLF